MGLYIPVYTDNQTNNYCTPRKEIARLHDFIIAPEENRNMLVNCITVVKSHFEYTVTVYELIYTKREKENKRQILFRFFFHELYFIYTHLENVL